VTQSHTSNDHDIGASPIPMDQHTIRRSERIGEVHQTGIQNFPHVENGTLDSYRPLTAAYALEPRLDITDPFYLAGTQSASNSLSPSPGRSSSSDQPQSTNSHSDLIRDGPTPALTDFSADAQIIRTARSQTGRLVDFTWTQHYNILYHSVMTARITELNNKLFTGLKPQVLMREILPTSVPGELRPLVVFSQTGLQQRIDWMWCWEHIELMRGLDPENTELDLETLDTLVKRTGSWMVRPLKGEGQSKAEGQDDIRP
jgi:hypothetical protein